MKFVSKIVLPLILISSFSQSYAFDLTHKFGFGIGGGYPLPVWGNQFNDAADAKWEASVFGKYFFDQSFGMELGVSMSDFKDVPYEFKNINLLGLWRMAGSASITPVLGLGAALTDIKSYTPASAKLSLLGRLGGEFDISHNMTVGVLADYQYVSKIMGDMPTNPAHVVIPQLTYTWYFGGSDGGAGVQERPAQEMPKEEKMKESTSAENVSDIVGTKSSATIKKPDLTVLFDSEKADIKNEYRVKLKDIADKMKMDTSIAGIIEGHADSTGPRAYNDQLSKRRALAVKKQLIEYGVEEARIETEGFGEDNPVSTNKTKAGRAQNRNSALFISIKERSDVM